MNPELKRLSRLLREAAATQVMPNFLRSAVHQKSDGSLVTEADVATQEFITSALRQDFPGIPLLGEEMTTEEQQHMLESAASGVWVLDPIDGTTNYASGFPAFGISLALIRNGEFALGVVLDPVRDECFAAARGEGATLNGDLIHTRASGDSIAEGIAMMDMKRLPLEQLPALLHHEGFRSQRNLGTVALEWCWLACGRFQLYLHGRQKLWDYAAGRLIAMEAGAVCQLYEETGEEPASAIAIDPRLAIAAANEPLFRQWQDFIALPWKSSS